MRLPDCCFGTRWPISLQMEVVWGGDRWAMARMAGCDRIVIWDLWVYAWGAVATDVRLQLKLGHKLPGTFTEGEENVDLLASFGLPVGTQRRMEGVTPLMLRWPELRKPIALQGRRLILYGDPIRRKPIHVWAGIVISEIPKEVPKWAI